MRNIFPLILFFSLVANSLAEVHQWTDEKGRVHFSDTPPENLASTIKELPLTATERSQTSDVQAEESNEHSVQSLNQTAKKMKKLREQRAKAIKKSQQEKRRKHLKQQKRIANIAKKKKACNAARKQQDAAFRHRTQQKNLTGMRKALANYNKKSAIRKEKCK